MNRITLRSLTECTAPPQKKEKKNKQTNEQKQKSEQSKMRLSCNCKCMETFLLGVVQYHVDKEDIKVSITVKYRQMLYIWLLTRSFTKYCLQDITYMTRPAAVFC